MPIAAVAVAVGGAIVAGGAIAGSAGSDINEQRAQAILKEMERKALKESKEGFEFQEAELRPFIDVGQESLGTLSSEIDELTRPFTAEDFEASPGFQFRIEQGEKAINNALSQVGLTESGPAAKALVRFNQGEASSEFSNAFNRFTQTQGNRFNRLLSLVDTGQRATEQLVSAKGTEVANNINTIRQTGQAVADRQSTIGEIQNQARARRGEAIAGAATSISESAGTLGAGPGGVT